jgi:hypothetical protein
MTDLPPAVDKLFQVNRPYITKAVEATRDLGQEYPMAYLLFDLTDEWAAAVAAELEKQARLHGSWWDPDRRAPVDEDARLVGVPAVFAELAFGAPKCPDDGVSFTLVLLAEGTRWSQVMRYIPFEARS